MILFCCWVIPLGGESPFFLLSTQIFPKNVHVMWLLGWGQLKYNCNYNYNYNCSFWIWRGLPMRYCSKPQHVQHVPLLFWRWSIYPSASDMAQLISRVLHANHATGTVMSTTRHMTHNSQNSTRHARWHNSQHTTLDLRRIWHYVNNITSHSQPFNEQNVKQQRTKFLNTTQKKSRKAGHGPIGTKAYFFCCTC